MKYVKADNGYYLPKRVPGSGKETARLIIATSPEFIEAINRVCSEESKRLGVKISYATLIYNLTMQGSNEFRKVQSRLAEIHQQLNKDTHHVKQDQQEEPKATT